MNTATAGKMDTVSTRPWFATHKWLLARRISQLAILGLFLLGPLAGIWIIKGTLSASLLLNAVPMTDPLLVLQSLAAGILPASTALIGFAVVVAFYVLVGGRTYCSWVCPVNLVTDLANWLRRRFNITMGRAPSRSVRYFMLAMVVIVSAVTGTIVWEWVNPVSMFHRGLIFGMGLGWTAVMVVFLYDLFVAPRGWCGHVCPMGACYSLIGRLSLVRVSAAARGRCNDCMDCFTVCPEPQVIKPALKGTGSPVIKAANCTNCARCIEVCSKEVFNFTTRFSQTLK